MFVSHGIATKTRYIIRYRIRYIYSIHNRHDATTLQRYIDTIFHFLFYFILFLLIVYNLQLTTEPTTFALLNHYFLNNNQFHPVFVIVSISKINKWNKPKKIPIRNHRKSIRLLSKF